MIHSQQGVYSVAQLCFNSLNPTSASGIINCFIKKYRTYIKKNNKNEESA